MKKVLLYNFYVNDVVTDNKNYIIHKECLKHYRDVFDKMIFYISITDLNDKESLNSAIDMIKEICEGKSFDLKIRQTTFLCEADVFNHELIENRQSYKDSFVFVAHTKNVTRLTKNLEVSAPLGWNGHDTVPESVIKWCIGSYFYSLNFINEVEKKLLGCPLSPDLFYGPFLTQFDESNFSEINITKSKCFYVGTFYWINMTKFNNLIDLDKIKLPVVDDRYFFEILPSVICNRYDWGGGLSSHNEVCITSEFDLYKMNDSEWDYLISILGDGYDYWNFYGKIRQTV